MWPPKWNSGGYRRAVVLARGGGLLLNSLEGRALRYFHNVLMEKRLLRDKNCVI